MKQRVLREWEEVRNQKVEEEMDLDSATELAKENGIRVLTLLPMYEFPSTRPNSKSSRIAAYFDDSLLRTSYSHVSKGLAKADDYPSKPPLAGFHSDHLHLDLVSLLLLPPPPEILRSSLQHLELIHDY